MSRFPPNCYYCERPFGEPKCNPRLRTKDHVIPVSEGGTNNQLNIRYACKHCNGLKGNKTLEQFAMQIQVYQSEMHKHHFGKLYLATILKNVYTLIEEIAPYRESLKKKKSMPKKSPYKKSLAEAQKRCQQEKKTQRPNTQTPLWWRE